MEELCYQLRQEIKDIEVKVRSLLKHGHFEQEATQKEDRGEMKANIMLTVRHLEDARMRVGKIIQAKDGGVSCYPK